MEENKYTVLYVDDEEINLRTFQRAFKRDYNIITALSGEEGLQILEKEEIHLIITDQKMPTMTGVDFLRHTIVPYPDKVRMILTGYSDLQDIMNAVNECGIFRYLTKPYKNEDMKRSLEEALEVQRLRQSNQQLISQLTNANNLLENNNLLLEKLVHERTQNLMQEIDERKKIEADLYIAKEKAENATKARELFLSTMTHEIRTPLNAIIGLANLLQDSDLSNDQKENLDSLAFSGTHLLALVNDILDFSKINAGKIEFEKLDFDLLTTLKNVHRTFQQQAQNKKLDWLLDIDDKIQSQVVGDMVRLGQILNNLLGNALKFTETGYIKLSVQVLSETAQNYEIRFQISDTGIGIATEKHQLIFENFSQAASDTTRKYGGTGLGLAITKQLIELQGGKIDLDSQIGQGTTFYFTLNFPKSSKNTTNEAVLTEAHQQDLQGKKILVAEDNNVNQMLVRKFLRKWNAIPEFAENGRLAFQKVQSDNYDLVLMDIQMPEMDGYKAAAAIRELGGKYKTIPIIALTASTLSSEKNNFDDYVVKPFEPYDLYQILHKYLFR